MICGHCAPADARAWRAPGGNKDYLPFDLLELAFWVSADAATDLTEAGVRGLLNNLAAVEATRAEVCSFVGFLEDMRFSLSVRGKRERREPGPAVSHRMGQTNNCICPGCERQCWHTASRRPNRNRVYARTKTLFHRW